MNYLRDLVGLVVEEILLEPGREQPRRRQRLDVARVRDAADVIGGRQAVVSGEEDEGRETAADLELTRVEVSVRKAVTRDVENRPQKDRREP
jgi:hypothetical protein